jgi:hypothetical protein
MEISAEWVVGFVDGEGCFHVGIAVHKEMTLGVQVLPEFTVVQHKRDVQLLVSMKDYFGCGVVRVNHGDRMAFRVRKIEHLRDIIIPFFTKHPLKSKKAHDFDLFKEVLSLMKSGAHLSNSGLDKIRTLVSRMNRGMQR